MSLNHAVLMGTIDRGPELRMTQSGVAQTTFTLAMTRQGRPGGGGGGGGGDVIDRIRVVAWRALAEKVGETCQKGDTVVVEGRLTTRSYETQDGQRRKDIEVDASGVTPVGGAKPSGARGVPTTNDEPPDYDDFSDLEAPAPPPRAAAPARRPAPPPPEPDLDDDIPF